MVTAFGPVPSPPPWPCFRTWYSSGSSTPCGASRKLGRHDRRSGCSGLRISRIVATRRCRLPGQPASLPPPRTIPSWSSRAFVFDWSPFRPGNGPRSRGPRTLAHGLSQPVGAHDTPRPCDKLSQPPGGHAILGISNIGVPVSLTRFFPNQGDKGLRPLWAGTIATVAITTACRMLLGTYYLSDASAGAPIGLVFASINGLLQRRIVEDPLRDFPRGWVHPTVCRAGSDGGVTTTLHPRASIWPATILIGAGGVSHVPWHRT